MPLSHGVRGFVSQNGNGRQQLVLSDDPTKDAMQTSGRWIATTEPAEVRP